MKTSGRLSAAIEILTAFETRPAPLKTIMADWARQNRFAGAKDRAWISGLILDVLRRKRSLAVLMDDDDPRAACLAALHVLWGLPHSELADAAAEDPHGPGPLTDQESAKLGDQAAEKFQKIECEDYPAWMASYLDRAFGDARSSSMAALSERADIDLRLNTLKSPIDRTIKALKPVKAVATPVLASAARIPAPPPSEKSAAVTVIPAFNKGWVEVQDLGSQIAAAAAGDIKGKQVLDYCAGGGGKTLALAALMENSGQLYAWDRDPRRLKPIFHRAKRAGVRNLQIRSPADKATLDDLQNRMDVVFVDAPCTGAGTWRRHPDAKWRLTEKHLKRRLDEQDGVLREAALCVKPGGHLVYVTCSFLVEENEDRIDAFLADMPAFSPMPAIEQIAASQLVSDAGLQSVSQCATSSGAIRLTPRKIRADAFFIAVMKLAN